MVSPIRERGFVGSPRDIYAVYEDIISILWPFKCASIIAVPPDS